MKLTEPYIEQMFAESDIRLTRTQATLFTSYGQEILSWNSRANLISKNDEQRIVERHFIECACLAKHFLLRHGSTVFDLGTGGGFPGVPLKIMRPDLQITLLDSKRWKTLFLKDVRQKFALDMEVLCIRAEDASQDEAMRETFDIVVSRAVTDLDRLLALAKPFLREGGALVAFKGTRLQEEIAQMKKNHSHLRIAIDELPLPEKQRSRQVQLVTVFPNEIEAL